MMDFLLWLDDRVLNALFSDRNLTAVLLWIRLSELGSTVVVIGLAACVAIVLLFRKYYALAAGLLVSVFGAGASALVIKELVHRARPDALYAAYLETGYAFPSAHATLAVALYGFCVYLSWRMIASVSWRWTIACVLTILIIVIAYSRLYLGVHYLSDVLGGLVVGFVWMRIGIAMTHYFERRALRATQDRA